VRRESRHRVIFKTLRQQKSQHADLESLRGGGGVVKQGYVGSGLPTGDAEGFAVQLRDHKLFADLIA
jgi:hypothetical protein